MGTKRKKDETFRFKATVYVNEHGFPMVDVPFDVGQYFSGNKQVDFKGSDTIYLRAVINGLVYHATLGVIRNPEFWVHEPDELPPITDYYLYLYIDMVRRLELQVGDELDIELSRDRHPGRLTRRGKLIHE